MKDSQQRQTISSGLRGNRGRYNLDSPPPAAHILVQTGDGGQAIRLGKDYQRGEAVGTRSGIAAMCSQSAAHAIRFQWTLLSNLTRGISRGCQKLLGETQTDSYVAGSPPNGSESPLRKSKRQELSIIRRTGNQVLLPIGHQGGNLDHAECAKCMSGERSWIV